MSSLKEIKEQIQSIYKIQKITHAMQNIAASKMVIAKRRQNKTKPYADKIAEVIQHLLAYQNTTEHLGYFKVNPKAEGIGYIILSSDNGLCGGFNSRLFMLVLQHLRKFIGKNFCWSLFGNQAQHFFGKQKGRIINKVSDLSEVPNVAEVVRNGEEIFKLYRKGKLCNVFIAFNSLNNLTITPSIKQLLPFEGLKQIASNRSNCEYEPSLKKLTEELILRYLTAQLFQTVIENIASEQVARMLAMQNATENTQFMIHDLKMIYNKIRQSMITTEIAEIIGGAEILMESR